MPQLKTKAKIIASLNLERQRLEEKIAGLAESDMLVKGVVGETSIKDALAHLADWEAHMPVWLEAARCGLPVHEIEEGLSWKQFSEFNERIYQRHKDQSLAEVLEYFRSIHRQFLAMVEAMPEDEMLQSGRYAFMGKSSVYTWLGHYAGHDRWATKHITKWLKSK